ncbi:hypothetical protein KDK95_08670 [Actinospica sp. MGRD01-02]|uniref:DUF5666 domain-containing protein n=1 Tax=Actinospica acidithermotolerans TaxID=2828514 RepID=A0A941E9L8_9ACTN|nr:DUF5666 domain-containing protein [Actinospica acidithermotolerans]MBR7826372.1 hypothetical protein [Actinospica acidithermotolerans]
MANKRTAGYGGYQPPKSNAPLMAVAVVAVAAAIGLLIVLVFANSPSSASAASDPTNGNPAPTQTYAGGGSGGGTLAALPPLSGNGGGLMYMLNGKVAAISSTSITLAGNGPSVTAAINSSTQVSGDISSVSGIKVGDQVTAQVSGQSSSSLVATAIQDPGTGP